MFVYRTATTLFEYTGRGEKVTP